MTAALYEKMVTHADLTIRTLTRNFEPPPPAAASASAAAVHLVSGGAAWSDHIAVSLFLRGDPTFYAQLTLHLPCKLVQDSSSSSFAFSDTKVNDWRVNPGATANSYHRKFSSVIRRDSLAELHDAESKGALFLVHNGFHARNAEVAKSTYVIAFSWAEGDAPDDGGTKQTWEKATAARKKIHVPLSTLSLSK